LWKVDHDLKSNISAALATPGVIGIVVAAENQQAGYVYGSDIAWISYHASTSYYRIAGHGPE
jgi:hypothetical protein